jgi:uncharacterized RmlC-like cupin family protein
LFCSALGYWFYTMGLEDLGLQFFPRPEDDSLELQAGFQYPSHLILPLLSDSVVNTQHIMQLADAGARTHARARAHAHTQSIIFVISVLN